MGNEEPNQQQQRFPCWIQFMGVALYFGGDILLRFVYKLVLVGRDGDRIAVQGYDKPAFLTLCCYMAFFLWGPILVFPYIICIRRQSVFDYYTNDWCGALGFGSAARYVLVLAAVLFWGNLCYIVGLHYDISVALATALSQGEAPFTVGLSVLLLGRAFGAWEQRGIVLCFAGIALIVIPPVLRANTEEEEEKGDDYYYSSNSNSTSVQLSSGVSMILGVLTTLVGAFGFGAYQVFWPLFDGSRYPNASMRPTTRGTSNSTADAIVDTFATLVLVGTYCISLGWMFLLFLHVLGLETFELPPRADMWWPLITASVLSAFVDAFNGLACVVATAVVVALAYPLIIPMSVVLDAVFNGISIRTWGWWGWLGTAAVVAGVFCLETKNITDKDDDEQEWQIEQVDVSKLTTLNRHHSEDYDVAFQYHASYDQQDQTESRGILI